MITFLIFFALMGIAIEVESYVNLGTIIITREAFIGPVLFGVAAELIVYGLRLLKEFQDMEKDNQDT